MGLFSENLLWAKEDDVLDNFLSRIDTIDLQLKKIGINYNYELKGETQFYSYLNPYKISRNELYLRVSNAVELLPTEKDIVHLSEEELKTLLDKNARLKREVLRFVNYYLPQKNILQWNQYTQDIRGFLYFSNTTEDKFSPHNIDAQNALVNMCEIAGFNIRKCKEKVNKAFTSDKLEELHDEWIDFSKNIYEVFFKIDNTFQATSLKFNKGRLNLKYGFRSSTIPENFIINFEQLIREQWDVDLIHDDSSDVKIIFEKNATPHVELDKKNIKIFVLPDSIDFNEINAAKIIVHEFGHLLGFNDCYIEFYDESTDSYIYYQLDEKDIMCHLGGQVQAKHKKLLKEII